MSIAEWNLLEKPQDEHKLCSNELFFAPDRKGQTYAAGRGSPAYTLFLKDP